MDDMELKKYCIETAIRANAPIVETSIQLYMWLTSGVVAQPQPALATVRKWNAPPLTKSQKAVLSILLYMRANGEKINGATAGRRIKCSGANASMHLRNLRKKGYLRQDGQLYTILRQHNGTEPPVIKIECPPMPAKGYKPLTAKLGAVGRVVS